MLRPDAGPKMRGTALQMHLFCSVRASLVDAGGGFN